MRDRLQDLNILLPIVEEQPEAMIALARQFVGAGDQPRATELAARALAMVPWDGEIGTLARELLSDSVPSWHFMIVRDPVRNQAYDRALQRAITPGCKVLEIGTGSGLLAMMAARAGAQVVTCEADPAVAAAARDVIAANGLSARIRVINKHSTALDLEEDLDGLADVLVSEIVSNDMLSEGTLPAHEDAVPRLLRPGGAVIPVRGQIRAALAEDRGVRPGRLRDVSGFDLTAFGRVARPYREIAVESSQLELRSDPVDLFDFDFASGGPWANERVDHAIVSTGGPVSGIVQWLALDMDAEGKFENLPGTGTPSCWSGVFWPFASPIETRPGEIVEIAARHEKDRMRVWRR